MEKPLLVISPHPDDMEIGMGGTVAKLVEAGKVVTSVVLTDGRRSPNPFAWSEEEMVLRRKEEAQQAATILGVQEVIFLGLPGLRSEQQYRAAQEQLTALLLRLQPVEIYTVHERLDRHPTHQIAGRLTRECLQASRLHTIGRIWAYEVWATFPFWDRIEYIDAQVGKKLQAIAAHKSQIASLPYGEGVLGLNRWHAVFADPQASETRGAFAEVFLSVEVA
ncbi:MAG: PIG-L family deacetylase [Nitrospinota bacterium]|nr:MAG: PIG-L family deacetylase [Nitrospinota bacterium]